MRFRPDSPLFRLGATPNRPSMRPSRVAPVSSLIATPPSVAIRQRSPLVSQVVTFATSTSLMTYVLGRISVGKNVAR